MKRLLQKVLGREALNNTITGFADILGFEKKRKASGKVIANERGFSHFTCKPLTHFCKFALLINKNFPLPQGAREEYFPSEASEKVLSPLTSHFSQTNPPQPSLGKGGRKAAFTLAEVLITLGIIGVVAAITMPTLVANYQKHVLYNQFMKAASTIENAINAYNHDYGCGEISITYGLGEGYNNLCVFDMIRFPDNEIMSAADKLGKYMNVAKWLTEDNYEEVCKGYLKNPIAHNYDGTNKDANGNHSIVMTCEKAGHPYEGTYSESGYGFITNDGMLIIPGYDGEAGNGSFVDINGPDKGPNAYGRDLFEFYLGESPSQRWSYKPDDPEEEYLFCSDTDKRGFSCGKRLLIEHKMNY